MSIKTKIESLSVEQRRLLAHSFDNMFSQVVESDGEFVGVHLDLTKHRNLQVLDTVGVWSYGKIKKEKS